MSPKLTLGFLLSLAAATLGIWFLNSSSNEGSEPPSGLPVTPGDAGNSGQPTPEPVDVKRPEKPTTPEPKKGNPDRVLLLPDGSKVPVLNGAWGAPALDWPSDRPWSKIIGRERDDSNLEWYVHADGSRSITQNIWRDDLNRFDPSTVVATPIKALPMHPDDIAKNKAEQEAAKKQNEATKNPKKD